MHTVQQILQAKSAPLLSVSPDTTVYDALTMMAHHDVGALAVLDHGELVGMFSERDYARKVILHGKSSRDLPVSDIMTESVVSVRPENTVRDCMALMTDRRIRHLPVLDGGRAMGMVSIGDVVHAMLSDQQFVIKELERYITA
jgi:CBS domain-containing protein